MSQYQPGSLGSVGALCRLDVSVITCFRQKRWSGVAPMMRLVGFMVTGAAMYGAAFAIWRSPLQIVFSMAKMPMMMLAVTVTTGLLSAIVAQVMGSKLSFAQVGMCILFGFSITSVLLGALSPITAYLSTQVPGPETPGAMVHYRILLSSHTAIVGLCGLGGYWRLHALLSVLIEDAAVVWQVLAGWIGAAFLVGSQLSWLLSPFLCRPDTPITFFNPIAFQSNFFEYLWAAAMGRLPGVSY